ncbi:MAG TPA: FAD-dependent oxidoreductase [Acidimicrobiales bacterium]|nr:FAD-dependent oxidoreductase [Acidimicrobiales bacterium]
MRNVTVPAATRLERRPVEERNFKGGDPRGRPDALAEAAQDTLERQWRRAQAYDRQAVVIGSDLVAPTGTLVLTLQVIDGEGFEFLPGQFVGVAAPRGRIRRRRSPYCILSAAGDGSFRLLVRVVPEGPLSLQLAELSPGDVVNFRGPTGRSMLPRETGTDLVLLATGVGVSPLLALAHRVLRGGEARQVRLLWGLRMEADICLRDEIDELAAAYPNFSYQISLSQPGPGWPGLRGRLDESAPAAIGELQKKHFYLVGNGEMTSEFAAALRELEVDETMIYEEAFFHGRLRGDPAAVAVLRTRFLGDAPLSPVIDGETVLFPLENPLGTVRRAS